MDIISISKKTLTPPTTMKVSTEESDTADTCEPLQTHLNKALSLTTTTTTKGCSLRPFSGHHQPPPQEILAVYSYKECLKNHAAKIGGLAVDGCGEFLQSPNSSPLDPSSLTCAACGCHRNFHRRYPSPPSSTIRHFPAPLPQLNWSSTPGSSSPSGSPVSSPISAMAPPPTQDGPNYLPAFGLGVVRKRTRTKFTEEQKAKMLAFAETLGWKMMAASRSVATGSEHERMIIDFCCEVGVKRDVFKVWMHNNKHRRAKARGLINVVDDDIHGGLEDNESKVCIFGNNVGQNRNNN